MLNAVWIFLGVLYAAGDVCMWYTTYSTLLNGDWGNYTKFDSPEYSPDLYNGHGMARAFVGPPPQVIGCIYAHLPRNSPKRSLIPRELVYNRRYLDHVRSFHCMVIQTEGEGLQTLCHSGSYLCVLCTLGLGAGGQFHHDGCNSSQVLTTPSGEMREPRAA